MTAQDAAFYRAEVSRIDRDISALLVEGSYGPHERGRKISHLRALFRERGRAVQDLAVRG